MFGFDELNSLLYKLHETENLPVTRLNPDPRNWKLISRCPLELTDYVIVWNDTSWFIPIVCQCLLVCDENIPKLVLSNLEGKNSLKSHCYLSLVATISRMKISINLSTFRGILTWSQSNLVQIFKHLLNTRDGNDNFPNTSIEPLVILSLRKDLI